MYRTGNMKRRCLAEVDQMDEQLQIKQSRAPLIRPISPRHFSLWTFSETNSTVHCTNREKTVFVRCANSSNCFWWMSTLLGGARQNIRFCWPLTNGSNIMDFAHCWRWWQNTQAHRPSTKTVLFCTGVEDGLLTNGESISTSWEERPKWSAVQLRLARFVLQAPGHSSAVCCLPACLPACLLVFFHLPAQWKGTQKATHFKRYACLSASFSSRLSFRRPGERERERVLHR